MVDFKFQAHVCHCVYTCVFVCVQLYVCVISQALLPFFFETGSSTDLELTK